MNIVSPAYAQITNPVLPGTLGSGGQAAGGTAIGSLFGAILPMFIIVGALATFIFLILGALQWITSGGDKQGLENARNRITNAVVGLIILAAVWAIMIVISAFLGLGTFGG
ncbi:hypothetical protein C4579_01395, partial [Candidatus Microgenomates bacterium]